ncbi:MAG: hypothetical protein ABI232_07965, partial [Jatrophihabitantaceae bacterium]
MPKTQLEKLWLGAGCAAGFILLLIGYFFFIGPQRSSTDGVNAQIDTAKLQNSSLQARINTLSTQNKDLAKYQSAVKQAELALPTTSGLPDFLRTLQSIGNSTLVDISSKTFGTPTDVTSVSGAAAPAAAPASAGGLHVYALPISIQVSGSVQSLNQFLTQLQAVQPRAVLISQISQTSGAAG